MIVYDLICSAQHRFEGWFPSAEGFVAQKDSGAVTCPVCGDSIVERLPSASRINREVGDRPQQSEVPVNKKALVQALVEYVLANAEDMGAEFAGEARRIHYGEAAARNIRGVASKAEADDLAEEGISVYPLPIPPRDGWH